MIIPQHLKRSSKISYAKSLTIRLALSCRIRMQNKLLVPYSLTATLITPRH